nr:hypothetical protein [Tanacetum cinerariifolium]
DSPLLGVNTPRSDEDRLKLMKLMVFLLQKGVCVEIGITAARLSSYCCQANISAVWLLRWCCLFWNTVSVKRSGDVTRLQDLVDKKKIVIFEAIIREILQLDDAEGVVCLPNEEIFVGLAQMGYEKPSTKLTFYKAFFSSQWKFLIHTILQSLSAKGTSWNEFSTAMASTVICLSKENVTEDVAHDAIPSPPPHDIPSPSQEPSSPPQQLQCSPQAPPQEAGNYQAEDKGQEGRMIDDMDKDEGIELVKDAEVAEYKGRHAAQQAEKQAKIYHIDLDHSSRVLSMQEDDSEVQEVVEVVTTAKLITEVVTVAASEVSAASATIPAAKPSIPTAAPTFVAAYTRRRKRVIIRDPEEELPLKTPAETPKVKDKGKAKRRKLSEEAQEAEDLRKRLEVVDDEDDDVFIEATPLARKVPVVDYQIVLIDNKPRFKIIKADETHQLYISFTTLLKNFDREDLENLWRIVKDRFSTLIPTNFLDEYLLLTLKTMFEEPNGQDAIWRNQKSVHGLALVKSWKLMTSCGVYVITLLTVQLFLLVERRYPL